MSMYGDSNYLLESALMDFKTWLEQFNNSEEAEIVSNTFEYFMIDLVNAYSKKKAELENK